MIQDEISIAFDKESMLKYDEILQGFTPQLR